MTGAAFTVLLVAFLVAWYLLSCAVRHILADNYDMEAELDKIEMEVLIENYK